MATNKQSWRLTMAEIRLYNPTWPEPMVQDYFARQQDIDNASGGGTGSGSTDVPVNQPAHGFTTGDCIRWDGVAFVLAVADSITTLALGVVVEVVDVDNFVYSITGSYEATHGLTEDTWYYLSDTVPGALTEIEPAISQPIVVTTDATHFSVYAYRPAYETTPGGGGGGEVNTSSNVGTGAGLALPKVGFDLPFKSILAGSNITVTPQANTITISASGGAVGGQVDSVVGGTDISVDSSDPVNPIVNFTGVIPPPGGQVDSVVGGTDISVDNTDPANPIVSYTGASSGQENPPFPDKPAGEPVVLVLTGQSNAVGATTSPVVPFQVNTRVFDWTTGGSGSVYSWQVPNLNASTRADFNSNFAYVGMPLGNRGNIGWSAADRIQRETGRDVYVICVAWNNQPIQQWYPGAEMNNLLDTQVPAALAAVPGSPTVIDGFIWMQGEANLQIVSPVNYLSQYDYADAFLNIVYADAITEGWLEDRYTQVAICELSPKWGVYGQTMLWQIQYEASEYFRVASSYNLPVAGDDIHFLPYSLGQLGEIAANGMMAGPSPKLKNPQVDLNDLYNVDVATAEQNQILYYDAASLTWKAKTSTSPLGIIEFDYRWSTAPNPTPASGRISANNTDPALITLIYVNDTSFPGNDLSLFWDNLDPGDWLNINAPGDYNTRVNFDVVGQPTKTGSVYTIPVTLFEDMGYRPSNNAQVSVFVRYTQTDDGLPPGGTDGQMVYKVGSDDYSATWGDPPFSVQSVVAGANITVDATDPANPIVAGPAPGGRVDSVVAGTNVTVDNTDPANPIVSASGGGGQEFATFRNLIYNGDFSLSQRGNSGTTATDSYTVDQCFTAGNTQWAMVADTDIGVRTLQLSRATPGSVYPSFPIELDFAGATGQFKAGNRVTFSGRAMFSDNTAGDSRLAIYSVYRDSALAAANQVNDIPFDQRVEVLGPNTTPIVAGVWYDWEYTWDLLADPASTSLCYIVRLAVEGVGDTSGMATIADIQFEFGERTPFENIPVGVQYQWGNRYLQRFFLSGFCPVPFRGGLNNVASYGLTMQNRMRVAPTLYNSNDVGGTPWSFIRLDGSTATTLTTGDMQGFGTGVNSIRFDATGTFINGGHYHGWWTGSGNWIFIVSAEL